MNHALLGVFSLEVFKENGSIGVAFFLDKIYF